MADIAVPQGARPLGLLGVRAVTQRDPVEAVLGVQPPDGASGRAQALSAEQRQLLLDIRREYPFATVPTILRTLSKDGRIAAGAVSDTTGRDGP